ncbi:MAG TPA: gamma-glutamyltransferase [Solirubrobacteraceae bacterium]|nr:gamma-glutamyltransferase [Solirubrobacteraceae bacterium]
MRIRLPLPRCLTSDPRAVVFACLLLAALPATALAKQTTARGSGGAVASDTVPATNAGLAVLRRGGTAADAAVAVASTLGVTDPFVAGIGGGGYFVYYDARSHRVYTIDGRETAPAAATSRLFIDPSTGKPLPFPTAVTSGLSVGIPGTLKTWSQALRRFGNFSLRADLAPAVQVARDGFKVTATLREETRENAFRFGQFTSTRRLFLPHGALPAVGSLMRNPQLAATYQQIGRSGVRALYGGRIGRDVVSAVHKLPLVPGSNITPRPGLMTLADLRRYSAPYVAPTHVKYRGNDVYSMAPSSSGGTTVGEALNILGHFNLSRMNRVQALHHYLEATRLAFADRNRYIGDRRYVNVPEAQLLSTGFARQRACLINPQQALTSPVAPGNPFAGSGGCTPPQPTTAAQPSQGNHTNHFVVADRYGDVVSYTNTIEQLGGSAIAVPGRGFLLNNELTDFDFQPIQSDVPDPNLPAGGKRPRSSMSPTIVLKRGKPVLALGAAGGATIITTVLQILVNKLDFGMTLPQALAAPRASQRNSSTTTAEPAFIARPTTQGLEQLGQKFAISDMSPLDPQIQIAPTVGVASAMQIFGHDGFLAIAEPVRRGGGAAGVLKR